MDKIEKQVYEYSLISKCLVAEPISVCNSREVYQFAKNEVFDKDTIDVKESFYAVFTDAAMQTNGFIKVSEGGIDRTYVDARIVFSAALKCLASGIVLMHNHPSGKCNPSTIDKNLTKKLVEGAKLLDIRIVDHIIVGRDIYFSFQENGMLD